MAKSSLLPHRHSHILIILLSILVGIAIAAVVFRSPSAQQQIAPPATAQGLVELQDSFVEVAAKVRPAVVNISAEKPPLRGISQGIPDELRDFFDRFRRPFEQPEPERPEQRSPGDRDSDEPPKGPASLGSGWIYSEDGYIVTNTHVVKDASGIKVRLFDKDNDSREYEAKVVGSDPKTELAVVKIDVDRKLPTLQLGDSDGAKVGQWVMAVGSPFGLDQTVTVGVISAKGRYLPQSPYTGLKDIIQTDAAINRGNSGGPMVNLRGEVIGINVAIVGTAPTGGNVGVGFAISASSARFVIPELIEHKTVKRGWLGISLGRELSDNLTDYYGTDHGALITDIHEGAPAAKSELALEDIIVAVDGERVDTTSDLQDIIARKKPGTTVTLQVIRNRKEMPITVKLGEMPARFAGQEQPEPTQEEEPERTSGTLGMTVRSITAQDREKFSDEELAGVLVTNVKRGSAAEDRIKAGDVISKMNQTAVSGLDDWEQALAAAKKADKSYVVLHVSRLVAGEVMRMIVDIDVAW